MLGEWTHVGLWRQISLLDAFKTSKDGAVMTQESTEWTISCQI